MQVQDSSAAATFVSRSDERKRIAAQGKTISRTTVTGAAGEANAGATGAFAMFAERADDESAVPRSFDELWGR
ncbi:hypothetical protein ACWEV3_28280 [Saccharopolyspora sp. NPDC003752]